MESRVKGFTLELDGDFIYVERVYRAALREMEAIQRERAQEVGGILLLSVPRIITRAWPFEGRISLRRIYCG